MEFLSFAAFLITLRETMEAALIVGILLAYLDKTGNFQLKRDVWIGTILAVVASGLAAVLFEVFTNGFEGDTEKLFEGIVMLLAASILTSMILWMFRNAKDIRMGLEEKAQAAISGTKKYAIFSLAFVAVFREGIETVLFLAGVTSNEPTSAVLFSGAIGIIVSIILAVLAFRGAIELNLRQFFNVTSIFLILFAAGLFSHGIHEFQELGWFGAESAPWNEAVWDSSSWLNDKDDGLGALFRALFGYQDKPSLLEIGAYVGYWLGIGAIFLEINKRGPLAPAEIQTT
ncbi:MAG: FTR1 family iron permease [Candidatus Hodarchaeales archaeon]